MSRAEDVSDQLIESMKQKNIDVDLTLRILDMVNSGSLTAEQIRIKAVPSVDNTRILDMRGEATWPVSKKMLSIAVERFPELSFLLEKLRRDAAAGGILVLGRKDLYRAGIMLMPYVAYGILNGGSATSYADRRKNIDFHPAYFSLVEPVFNNMAGLCSGRSKGITPAFIQGNGSGGPSFLELKLRALLLKIRENELLTGGRFTGCIPLFQMTNITTNEEIGRALESYGESPLLRDLVNETGIGIREIKTGVQPLIAAFTPASPGRPRSIFSGAYGKTNGVVPLPGGHGQNFYILRDIYRSLLAEKKQFVYLTNVDNLGSTIDPVSLAILALSGKQAGFDFSFKTPYDTKGGILVENDKGRLTCADIGAAVSREQVREQEEAGKTLLFNCATGLFDLPFLCSHLDEIIKNLPLRISEQHKDAGNYSQTEQITWEVLGLLDDFLVFAVEKSMRFLPSKVLIENFMASGIGLEESSKINGTLDSESGAYIKNLHAGLRRALLQEYGLAEAEGVWLPADSGL